MHYVMVEIMMNVYKSKDFAEQCARHLRCCGVNSAHVCEIIAYEVIFGKEVDHEDS